MKRPNRNWNQRLRQWVTALSPIFGYPNRMSMMRSARFAPLAIVYLNSVSALLKVCSTPHASGIPTNPQASASCSTVVPPSC